jgi:hypothetical protein
MAEAAKSDGSPRRTHTAVDEKKKMATETTDGSEPSTSGRPTIVSNEEIVMTMVTETPGVRKRTRSERGDGEDFPPTPTRPPDKAACKKLAQGPKPGSKSRKGSL